MDLSDRFNEVSRGRCVQITEKPDTLLSRDFEVTYDENAACFRIGFTRNGHFAGAYRFIERWIKRRAEQIDGVYKEPPADHLDMRDDWLYYVVEKVFDRHMQDLREGVARQIEFLETERPDDRVFGEVKFEVRVEALHSIVEHFTQFEDEVHSAVLSPSTVSFLRDLGIDLMKKEGSQQEHRGDA